MGWHMKLVICVQLAYVSVCLTREMSVVREWTSLDVQLTPRDGQESRHSIMPFDIDSWVMYKDRVFVTLSGQPYYLAYLDLTDNSTAPLLRPYPSYEYQQMIKHVYKVRVDRCDRLWMISQSVHCRKCMTVFDLKTDRALRQSSIPKLVYDMIVDDFDCDNEYVYFSDSDGVWTYSWAEDDSWKHIISKSITSMLLAPNSIVYYNVYYKSMVHYMSTTHLKDKSNMMSDITELGRSRKLKVNLDSSALDAESDIFYYFNDDNSTVIHNRPVIHGVPCWTSELCRTNCQDVSIDPTHKLMFITVVENGDLWAVTRRSSFENEKINFRLLSVPVKSACIKSYAKDITNTTASSTTEQTSTVGSVPKYTTVNIADTTAGTPNSYITQAIGGTNVNYVNINLFSFTNFTSNFTINNFPNNHFN